MAFAVTSSERLTGVLNGLRLQQSPCLQQQGACCVLLPVLNYTTVVRSLRFGRQLDSISPLDLVKPSTLAVNVSEEENVFLRY